MGAIGAGKATYMDTMFDGMPSVENSMEQLVDITKDLNDYYTHEQSGTHPNPVAGRIQMRFASMRMCQVAWALQQRGRREEEDKENLKVVVRERCQLDDLMVFGKPKIDAGEFDSFHRDVYYEMMSAAVAQPVCDGAIYIDCSEGDCWDHVQDRGREAENSITREYVGDIADLYRQFIEKNARKPSPEEVEGAHEDIRDDLLVMDMRTVLRDVRPRFVDSWCHANPEKLWILRVVPSHQYFKCEDTVKSMRETACKFMRFLGIDM